MSEGFSAEERAMLLRAAETVGVLYEAAVALRDVLMSLRHKQGLAAIAVPVETRPVDAPPAVVVPARVEGAATPSPRRPKTAVLTAGRKRRWDDARYAELARVWAIRPPWSLKQVAEAVNLVSPGLPPVDAQNVANRANERKLGPRFGPDDLSAARLREAAARSVRAPAASPGTTDGPIREWAAAQGLHFTGRNLGVINAARQRAKLPAFAQPAG